MYLFGIDYEGVKVIHSSSNKRFEVELKNQDYFAFLDLKIGQEIIYKFDSGEFSFVDSCNETIKLSEDGSYKFKQKTDFRIIYLNYSDIVYKHIIEDALPMEIVINFNTFIDNNCEWNLAI